MQRDKSKLKEAFIRKRIGLMFMLSAVPVLFNYALFLLCLLGGVDSHLYLFDLEHYSLLIALVAVIAAFIVTIPVWKLEEPFQYSLHLKRKAAKRDLKRQSI